MPAISASAPGKIILLGEHSVVYGKPAIAVPVTQVKAKAIITPDPLSPPGIVKIEAPDIHINSTLDSLPEGNPLGVAIRSVFNTLKVSKPPSLLIKITSTIPIASGLGSGAAVSIAIIRALSTFLGKPLPDDQVSRIAFEVERIYHGTPSGIDNTVITYIKPVFFIRESPIQFMELKQPFLVIIGDTGVQSSTAEVVRDLKNRVQNDPPWYESIFQEMGEIAWKGKEAIENANMDLLGAMMTRNHHLLQNIGVSSSELDRLVEASLNAGALGAKLSGGGRGGNMIALVPPTQAEEVARQLMDAGAVRTIKTTVGFSKRQV